MNYLGIDISKDKFDVALLEGKKSKHKVFKNNEDGFKRLIKWLETDKVDSLHTCMESTGRYGENLAKFLFKKKYKVSIVNPACIKAYGQSQLKRVKTDKIDALLIANFCRINEPSLWIPPSEEIEELVELTRRITHLGTLKQSEINHRKSGIRSEIAIRSAETIIRLIESEIEEIEERISEIIDTNAEMRRKRDLLKSIPGIGDRTAEVILSETKGGVENFESAKQLAAYAGITPKIKQSGSSLNSKGIISRLGNSNLRKALYFPAISAKKYNSMIIPFAKRLKERGKSGKQIICAIIRKLLHIVFGVLKSDKFFNPNYQNLSFSS